MYCTLQSRHYTPVEATGRIINSKANRQLTQLHAESAMSAFEVTFS